MHEFLAFTIVGLVIGATYAVAASGLVVTYTTTGIFNIAQGAIGMFMAFVYWQFSVGWHWPVPLALIMTVLVIAPLFGAVFERLVRPVSDSSVAIKLVLTIAVTVLLIGVVQSVWKGGARQLPPFFGNHGFQLAGVLVTWEQVITIGTAIGVAVGLRLLLYRTRTGIAMRGVVDNRGLVALNGGRPVWIGTVSWALGSSLAALAGILVAPQLQLAVIPLTLLVVNAYAAAMFGRLRNLPMTFVGALAIGLLVSYATGYLPTQGSFWGSVPLQGLRLSIPAVMLFVVLLVLPQDQIRGATLQARRLVTATPTFLRSLQGAAFLVIAVTIVTGFLEPGKLVYLGTGLAFALIMLSLVPLTGWGGQVSLCQMTFAGIGAVAMSHFGKGGSPVGLLAAAGITAAVGAVIALPALRLRGLYLALATLAFALCMDNMFFPTPTAFSFNGSVPIPRPSVFGLHLSTQRAYVIFLAVVFSLVSIGLLALRRGPFGRVLSAMKDSEAACATLGLNLTLTKLVVFALSAGIAGFAGALYGAAESVAGATQFNTFQSLPILLLVVVGGVTTCSGALLGGVLYGFGPAFQSATPRIGSTTFLGTGLLALLVVRYPDGVMPPFYNALAQWWQGLTGGATAIGPGTPVTPGAARKAPRPAPAPQLATPGAPLVGSQG
jgi:branched-chain amino acid transport system permease protein